MDLTLDYNPIITSVAVSPAIGTYNNPSVFTFTAVDPANGAVISEYHLESTGIGNQLQVAQFEATSDNTADEPFDAQKCQTNNLASCDIQYQPALPDAGNFEWTLTVTDDTGNQDDVSGFFAVNAAGTIDLTIDNWHIPVVDSVASADNLGTPTSEIQFGKSGILTFQVTDPDITNGLGDSLTLAVNSVSTLQTLSEGTQGDAHGLIGCPATGDIAIVNTGTVGDTVTFTATWEPWAAASGSAVDYGTWGQLSRPPAPPPNSIVDTNLFGILFSELEDILLWSVTLPRPPKNRRGGAPYRWPLDAASFCYPVYSDVLCMLDTLLASHIP